LKKYWNQTWHLFAIMSVIIILDQLTKWLVRSNLELGEVWMPLVWLAPYARIVHWFNTGVAFGLLQELGKYSMIFSILVVALIMYYFPQISRTDWLIRLALAMQAGGGMPI
jgi:signal peptidase II